MLPVMLNAQTVDTSEFQIGYPGSKNNAITQLKGYPSPRYVPNTNFFRIYNWMDPAYSGGQGQPGLTAPAVIRNAVAIQEELALNWNYFIVIPNSVIAQNEMTYKNGNSPLKAYVDLANKYPNVSLGVTTFWTQIRPDNFGYKIKSANIVRTDLPNGLYIDTSAYFKNKVLNYTAPDSLFTNDGKIQALYIQNIVNHLTRPITLINENGEEPPLFYPDRIVMQDKSMCAAKLKGKYSSWDQYQSTRKKALRNLYTSQFLKLPALNKTAFTIYQNDGVPGYRFNWNIGKSMCSKINGNYYATSDYYPQYPSNWAISQGPWHGWDWINISRQLEIKSGDRFFSPYIAAGWSKNPENDIRPAQWLGLLKCMTVVGAEFFYTGYFNLKSPFSLPENYIWQAAIPSYAQAMATHFTGLFRTGNVLYDAKGNPIITYPDNDKEVLVTVRKSSVDKFVIAAAVQTNSNVVRSALQKTAVINIQNQYIKFTARRQGSVYIYDKTIKPAIFYQLDAWHESTHPDRWKKYWTNEAEVFDSSNTRSCYIIKSEYKSGDTIDFTNVKSYLSLSTNQWVNYTLYSRDIMHLKANIYVYLLIKSATKFGFTITTNGSSIPVTGAKLTEWTWIKYPISILPIGTISTLQIKSLSNYLCIDKIIISDENNISNN